MGKTALVTILKDENIMLPTFMDYYRKNIDDEDIYIYDNGSTDGCVEAHVPDSINVRTIDFGQAGYSGTVKGGYAFDHISIIDTMNSAASVLLNEYKTVIHADIDEIMVPNLEKYEDLRDFLDRNKKKVVTTSGFEIIQAEGEAALDWSNTPLLEQRSKWWQSKAMCKPLVLREFQRWKVGHHRGMADIPDPNLLLLHLHRLDWNTIKKEHARKAAYIWSPEEIESGRGVHNRVTDDVELKKWFTKGHKNATEYPDWVRRVI